MPHISGSSAANVLSAYVLKQIDRLGGRIPDDFQPRDWSVSTPAGEHQVPSAVQALLAVTWPADQGLCTNDEFRWEVHLPSHCEVGPMVVEDEPSAWYAIGGDEGQWYLLVDLAEADTDDFPVYRVDHDGSDDASNRRRLSSVLGDLRVVTGRIVFPSSITAGETAAVDGSASADAVLTNADSLVNMDPLTLLPLLDRVTTDQGRQAVAVYRTSVERHRDADVVTRRQMLALDAARWGAYDLSRALAEVSVPGAAAPDWTIDWATGAQLDPRRLSQLSVGGPQVIAELQGRTVVATLDAWTLHVHDLATGVSIVETELECSQEFAVFALAELDGRWIAVTGSSCPGCDRHDTCEGQIRRWNLADGNPLGDPVRAHLTSVDALAVTEVNGRQVILSGGYDNMLRMWDLRTGEPIGSPTVGHRKVGDYGTGIVAIAVGELDGRPVAVTGGGDGAARVWDLTEGATPGRILLANVDYEYEDAWVISVALGDLDGTPVAVTSGSDIRVWDLRSGQQLGPEVTDRWGYLDLVDLDGRPVVAAVDFDGWVRMWDLRTREELGSGTNIFTADSRVVKGLATVQALGRLIAVVPDYKATAVVDLSAESSNSAPVGHTNEIEALAVTETDGLPVVVTGARDRSARIWNLNDGTPVCPPLSGHSMGVDAVATTRVGDRPTVLTSDGYFIRAWDQATGELSREIEAIKAEDGHQVLTLAATYLDGRAVAVTGGYDHRVLTWELDRATRADYPPITLQEEYVHSMMTAELDGRSLVIVKDDPVVRVVDLATGEQLSTLDHEYTMKEFAVAESQGRVTAVTTTYQKLHVWDVATGTKTGQLDIGDGWVSALALADVGGHLIAASAGHDRTVHTWDLTESRPYRASLTFPEEVKHLAITPQGRLVVAFGSDLAVFTASAGLHVG